MSHNHHPADPPGPSKDQGGGGGHLPSSQAPAELLVGLPLGAVKAGLWPPSSVAALGCRPRPGIKHLSSVAEFGPCPPAARFPASSLPRSRPSATDPRRASTAAAATPPSVPQTRRPARGPAGLREQRRA